MERYVVKCSPSSYDKWNWWLYTISWKSNFWTVLSYVLTILIYLLFLVGCRCCLWSDLNFVTQKPWRCSFLCYSMCVYCSICIFHRSHCSFTLWGNEKLFNFFVAKFNYFQFFVDRGGHSIFVRLRRSYYQR